MAIEIKIVIDPFAFGGRVPRERVTKEEIEHIRRAVAIQRERDERYHQKMIEKGLLRSKNKATKE